MEGTRRLPYLTYQRNLYAGEHPTMLAIEAARLDDNRRLIGSDLRRDPGSWTGGRNNIDVLDVLFSDAISMMLTGSVIARVAA